MNDANYDINVIDDDVQENEEQPDNFDLSADNNTPPVVDRDAGISPHIPDEDGMNDKWEYLDESADEPDSADAPVVDRDAGISASSYVRYPDEDALKAVQYDSYNFTKGALYKDPKTGKMYKCIKAVMSKDKFDYETDTEHFVKTTGSDIDLDIVKSNVIAALPVVSTVATATATAGAKSFVTGAVLGEYDTALKSKITGSSTLKAATATTGLPKLVTGAVAKELQTAINAKVTGTDTVAAAVAAAGLKKPVNGDVIKELKAWMVDELKKKTDV